MIICYIKNTDTAETMILSAYRLSRSLEKSFGIVVQNANKDNLNSPKTAIEVLLNVHNIAEYSYLELTDVKNLALVCEEHEVSFLFLQLTDTKSTTIQKLLTACRELRIPYIFFNNDFDLLKTDTVMVPVNFLEEELEKAQFASAFGRFCNSKIELLQANDYGSKAATNTVRIKEFLDKFELNVHLKKAQNNSFKVDKEAIQLANNASADLVIVTASREYGLDDILFGPKELHLIKKSTKPILLVNPRGDLYALCD